MTLAARRKALGLTQDDVAQRAPMPQSTVSALERGVIPNPGIDAIEGLARALDWTVQDVVAALRETVAGG